MLGAIIEPQSAPGSYRSESLKFIARRHPGEDFGITFRERALHVFTAPAPYRAQQFKGRH
jgi:hypothetical protein